jgi:hypothetical protein
MLVSRTAEGIKASVNALRFPDVREGVTFHTFALPEERCLRLLVRNLGRRMPEGRGARKSLHQSKVSTAAGIRPPREENIQHSPYDPALYSVGSKGT